MWPKLLLASLSAFLVSMPALAQIATDGTTGPRIRLSGGSIELGASLGTQAGANLFHSFKTFNINHGQTVTFTGPDSVRNVVSRVTGAKPSTIDGTLRSTVAQADLYFINPAGVTFGPTAVVDVPANLHVGTAHEVRFADGTRFSALDKSGSSFTSAAPEAFGFLNRPAAKLRIDRSTLTVKPGKTLSLIGGDVEVSGGTGGQIEAPGGAVTIASVTGDGQVRTADGSTTATKQGKVQLNDRAWITTSGNGGGSVKIRGGSLVVENATVTTNNTGSVDATGGIDIQGTSLDIANSTLASDSTGTGKGAPIKLRSEALIMREGARVASRSQDVGGTGGITIAAEDLSIEGTGATFSTVVESDAQANAAGEADPITIVSDRLAIRNGGAILSRTRGASKAADLAISSGDLIMEGDVERGVRSRIVSESSPTATGDTGSVNLAITASLQLTDTAQIASRIEGRGNAGPVTVNADTINITGGAPDVITGIFSQAVGTASGNSGTLNIYANDIDLSGSFARISGDTFSLGNAGDVNVNSGSLSLNSGSWISSDTFGEGNGGLVNIQAGSLTITGNDGVSFTGISSDAVLGSDGDAGTVSVTTDGHLEIRQGGQIGSSTFSTGNAGEVSVKAGSLAVYPGSWINSDTFGNGNGGSVTVQAGSLTIIGNDGLDFTGISSNAIQGSNGDAGTVSITTDGHLSISQGGQIGSNTFSGGDARDVTVQAGSISIVGTARDNLTGISSNATRSASHGDAGTVSVTSSGLLAISQGGEISSNTFARGDAGAVHVQAGSLVIHGLDGPPRFTGIGSSAESGSEGDGGGVNVTIDGNLVLSRGGQIRSITFEGGDAGIVTVQAGHLQIDGGNIQTLTGVLSSTQPNSTGNGGAITIQAGDILLRQDGSISAESEGSGLGGSIIITASDRLALDGAAIRTQTDSADGGDIAIHVGRQIDMQDSSITTSVAGGTGSGGNIGIDPPFVILDSSDIQANAQRGRGGNITIRANQLLATPDSVIEASSAESVSGTISSPAPNNTIANSLVQLPESFLNARDLLHDTCTDRGKGPTSSLILGNGGGLPLDPAGPLPSPYSGLAGPQEASPVPESARPESAGQSPPLMFHTVKEVACR